jgi:hypothetical protein
MKSAAFLLHLSHAAGGGEGGARAAPAAWEGEGVAPSGAERKLHSPQPMCECLNPEHGRARKNFKSSTAGVPPNLNGR